MGHRPFSPSGPLPLALLPLLCPALPLLPCAPRASIHRHDWHAPRASMHLLRPRQTRWDEDSEAAPARCQCRLGMLGRARSAGGVTAVPSRTGGARRSAPNPLASVVCQCVRFRAAAVAVGHAQPDSVEADEGATQAASLGTVVTSGLVTRACELWRVCGAYRRRMRCGMSRDQAWRRVLVGPYPTVR